MLSDYFIFIDRQELCRLSLQKTAAVVPFLTLVLLATCAPTFKSIVLGSPNVISVPGDYSTIQAAVNAANPGDRIEVAAGVYYEHVIVNKTVAIVGSGYLNTTIDGNNTGTIFYVTASHVEISNFNIEHSGDFETDCGIYIHSTSHNNTLSSNRIIYTYHDIYLNASTLNHIERSKLYRAYNGGGIYMQDSNNNTIQKNSFLDAYYGIYLGNSHNNTISDNALGARVYGMYFLGSHHNIVENSPSVRGSDGIVFFYSHSNIIRNNAFSGSRNGVWLKEGSSFNVFTNNSFIQHDHALHASFSDNNAFMNNTIEECDDGVYLDTSHSNTVIGNTIQVTKSSGRGIYLTGGPSGGAEDNLFENNTVTGGRYGIEIRYSNHNLLRHNMVFGNHYGVYFDCAGSNTLRNNIISDNVYGMGLGGGNTVYHYVQDIDMSNTINGKPIVFLSSQHNQSITAHSYPDIGYLGIVNSTNILVRGFTLTDNVQGVLLAHTTNCTIKNMTVRNNIVGIRFYNLANNNTVTKCIVENNGYGFRLWSSVNNTLYHNNVVDNSVQVEFYVSPDNQWDFEGEGNYWSNYNGYDKDSDGIGDIPFYMDPDNHDDFPLMEPYMYLQGDANNDGTVDVFDLIIVAAAYGTTPIDPNWNPQADTNEDYVVDIFDLINVAAEFGKTYGNS